MDKIIEGMLTYLLKPDHQHDGYRLTCDKDFMYLHIPGQDIPRVIPGNAGLDDIYEIIEKEVKVG